MITHGSLCSGIGGFDLAAEWMGWTNIFSCEKDEKANLVLEKRFPNVTHHRDLFELDGKQYEGKIDILTAGVPCQDASIALQTGNGQKGLKGTRTSLWFECERFIRESRPKVFVFENVANILKTNNGRDWFTIINSLDAMGYNAEWRVTRASEIGAIHQRARVFMVAYTNGITIQENQSFFSNVVQEIPQGRRLLGRTNASVGISWGAEPPVCLLDDGIPKELECIKQLGNAIVPQVAYEIFKGIDKAIFK